MKPKGKSMEKWKEVNKDMIPVGNYLLRLQCGDSEKFTVYLESDKYGIVLEFEEALSFHCVDEGQWLFLPYDDKPFDLWGNDLRTKRCFIISSLRGISFLRLSL